MNLALTSRAMRIGGISWRGLATVLAGMLLLATAPSFAQETTSSIKGSVTTTGGAPVAGATVTVTDTRNGKRRSLTTTSSGNYTASGLRVGGPYRVVVSSDAHANQTINDVFVSLGSSTSLATSLGDDRMEEVVTTAVAVQAAEIAIGPATSFNLDDLENAPAINRDIKDLIRIDPRIYVDEADVDGIQCNGASPRFNSLTVDGVKLNDNFGLNRNGYPTQRMPFPYDALDQVAVELAPYDVHYGGFTACNINAVTKSGANEFHGNLFYDYTSDSFIGDSLEGDIIPPGDFLEDRYGFAVGGPIIQDKLFFFVAYQKDKTSDSFDRCAGDATCGRPVTGVTQAQIDRIDNIARTVYDYDPGEPITNAPVNDEKYLIKFDWNINDQHRANIMYNFNEGVNLSTSDGDDDEYEFSNHFFNRGATLDAYTAMLFSDWTDQFSTEARVGVAKLDNSQITRNNVAFPEFQVETWADIDNDGNFDRTIVYLGGDDSRQSNKLDYEAKTLKLAGSYSINNHVISGGFEREDLDVANLFLQHSIGEYRFDEMCGPDNPSGCIDALEALSPDDIYYGNAAGTNNPADAAGALSYAINSLYVQDEMFLMSDDLQLVFGLRYDWYTSDDLPTENQNFIDRNGFTNATNFDGEGLIQPRFGFNWDVNDRFSVRGGIGLFSGGNPNVWLTNNYQVDGVTQIQARDFNVGLSDLNVTADSLATVPLSGAGRPGYDIPQAFVDFVADGSADSQVNALAPDFEIPSNWKFSLGGSYEFDLPRGFGTEYSLSGDVLISKGNNSAIIRDASLTQTDTAPDGRPIYTGPRNSDFILGNVEGDDSKQTAYSLSLSKDYEFGLDWTLGYSYVKAEDVSPMTSSVAFSNFANISVSDPNNPGRAISNYQIPQRFILKVGYAKQFFRDYDTRFTLFGSSNKGRPYSYVFTNDDGDVFGDGIDRRHLLYMPTGANDPNVVFDPGFDQAAFFAFADREGLSGYGGQIVPRNEFDSPWWTKFDLRISQEVRGFREDHRGSAFLVVENLGNLINDDWGILKEVGFPRAEDVVDVGYDPVTNQYIFESFSEPGGARRQTEAALWAIRFGVSYKF